VACLEALTEQEQRFLAALARVAQVQLENGILELTDADGTLVLKASRRENTQ
jgi:heat shock protein HslJ